MKKNKINGSKKFAYILVGAGAVALTGVAFSAWIITATPEPQTVDDVTISVGEVQEVKMAVTISDTDTELSFDCPEADTTSPIKGSSGSVEDLQFGFTATISNAVSEGEFSDIFGGYEIQTEYPTNLGTIAGDGKLVLPIGDDITVGTDKMVTDGTIYYSAGGDKVDGETGSTWSAAYSIDNDGTSLKIKFLFNFAWGPYFGNQNPGKFGESDASSMSVSDIETLKSDLVAMSTALSGENTIKVTFTPIAK